MSRFFLLFFCLIFSALAEEVLVHEDVSGFLKSYCLECHGGKKVKGKIDFTKIKTVKDLQKNYKMFESALDLVLHQEMPPEDELQPTEAEIRHYKEWTIKTFDKNVVARAGEARARRLSNYELHNSLSDILGFPLEVSVAKAEETVIETALVKRVLPLDPPGESGFKNDTHNNPLNNSNWESLAYIFDFGITELFSDSKTDYLEKYAGTSNLKNWSYKHSKQLLETLLPKIYRRPINQEAFASVLNNLKTSSDQLKQVKFELKVAFMSPRFLYRGMSMPLQEGQHPVDSFEYAERLSYFLWGSIPDQQLYEKAIDQSILKPEVMKAEIKRMVTDPKFNNFKSDFSKQWLALDEIKHIGGRTPYIQSLMQQPIEFMGYLIKENRPVLELIDSRVTYANYLMNKLYPKEVKKQLPRYIKPKGNEMVYTDLGKITLTDTQHRGGIFTMPGVLAMNASKGRTSPILRGTWALERILGYHLPDPPMDVNPVPPNKKGEKLTFRQRFERHQNDNACSVCHSKIDPLGFALEAYDAQGLFRTKIVEKGRNEALDTTGEFKGDSFNDFVELKHLLLTKHRKDITKNVVQRLSSYALCRKLELHDKPIMEELVDKAMQEDFGYLDLIFEICNSMPFKEVYATKEQI